MKSNDEYIVKIRNLCSEQGLFSLEELSVLTTIFESLSGKPPVVHTDRFRADNHQWLSLLDQFENPHQFLKRTGDGKFYASSPYALPLVEVARAVRLLDIMEKIYQNLKELYHDYLAEPVEVEILIDGIDGYDQDEYDDKEELLEALYYLSELSGVWSGKTHNFPYAEESTMCIAESVLRNDSMGGIIMQYFNSHYANPISPSSPDLSMLLRGDETKLAGADNTGPEIYNIHMEDFEEFSKVKETQMPENFDEMKDIKEKVFKAALGKILSESTPKDWGGETSDFVTSHLHISGERVRAAFLLKGPASFTPMRVRHLGKNGDQINRLAREPADVLVVQHCHDITSEIVEILKAFAIQPPNPRRYCVIDGRESLRLLKAYNLKEWALDESKLQ